MRLLNFTLLLFIIITTSACAKPKTMERHNSFYEGEIIQRNNVLIIPPVAEIAMVDTFGKRERMHDYEYHMEDLIHSEIYPLIREKGYNPIYLSKKDIVEKKLNNLVMQLRDIYDEETKALYKPALWEEEKAFSITENIGKIAVDLGKKTNTDLILVLDYDLSIKTSGARTAGFMLAMISYSARSQVENNDVATMKIGIIDTKNGNVLWTNAHNDALGLFQETKNHEDDVKRVRKILSKTLEPLQEKNAPIKTKE